MSDISSTFEQLQPFNIQLSGGQSYLLVSHKEEDESFKSCKISFENLAQQLNLSIKDIKSAAYCQSSDFALSSHDHDIYTSAMYNSMVTSDIAVNAMHINDITHSCSYDVKLSVEMSNNEYQNKSIKDIVMNSLPKLGQIRFIAVKDLLMYANMFDITNPSFIGWIPAANENVYELSNFILSSQIPNVFQTSNEGRFIVPNLVKFCKIRNSGDDANGSYEIHPGQTHTPRHAHALNIPGDGAKIKLKSNNISVDSNELNSMFSGLLFFSDKTINFTVDSTYALDRNVASLGIRNGRNDSDNTSMNVPLSKTMNDFSINNLDIVEEDGDDNDEHPYPVHNLMPVIIYIGPSLSTDFQRFTEFI